MFTDFFDYQTVLKPFRYTSLAQLLDSLEDKVITPPMIAANSIMERRAKLEKEMGTKQPPR